ncbi:hypothetical protein ACFL59_13125 [Planctomycetota bacterium]
MRLILLGLPAATLVAALMVSQSAAAGEVGKLPVLPSAELTRKVSARIYPRGRSCGKPLYLIERTTSCGAGTVHATWVTKRPDGWLLAKKTIRYRGGRFSELRIRNRWDGSHAVVTADNGAYKMSFSVDGDTDDDVGKLAELHLVRDQIIPFMRFHWDKLMGGETVYFRLFVPDRMTTVGFKLFRQKELTVRGQPGVLIKLRPSSMILGALVGSIDFVLGRDGDHRVIEHDARVKVKKDGEWQDVEATMVYDVAPTRVR